jgi:hypothetical protein
MLGNQAAGEHAGLEERVDIADGKNLFIVARAENRDLLVAQQRDAGGGRMSLILQMFTHWLMRFPPPA